MVDWVTQYPLILERLQSQLAAMKDERNDPLFQAVYVGKKSKPEKFPCVLVFPEVVRQDAISYSKSMYHINIDIRVIGIESTLIEGLLDSIMRLGKIEKLLISDRSFGNLVTEGLEILQMTPDVERPRVRTRHEAAMLVDFRCKL